MPMQASVDARLSRRFALGQRVAVEAIVEAFNLFDRTNYARSTTLSAPVRSEPAPPAYGLFTRPCRHDRYSSPRG